MMNLAPPPPFPGAEDIPPPYVNASQGYVEANAHTNANSDAEEEMVQPVILVLSKRFIHAQSSSSGGSGSGYGARVRAPLYELSHDITQSSDGETKATLSRMVPSVRTSLMSGGVGVPRIAHRSSHIYDLKRLPALIADGFPYCLDAVSRRNRRWSSRSAAAEVSGGNLGLKTSSFPRAGVVKFVRLGLGKESYYPKGFKAMRKTSSSGSRSSGGQSSCVFEWRKARDHCEWIGPEGSRIAVEGRAAVAPATYEDEDDINDNNEQLQLTVTTALPRTTMDALVASWCLKTWRDRIEHSIRNPNGCEFNLSFPS